MRSYRLLIAFLFVCSVMLASACGDSSGTQICNDILDKANVCGESLPLGVSESEALAACNNIDATDAEIADAEDCISESCVVFSTCFGDIINTIIQGQ